jgi:cytochrome c556
MIGFWRQRNAADAVKWSGEGKAAAVAMASAAHAGNTEAARAAFSKLEGGCKSCHNAYRVRLPNGRYAVRMDSGERKERKR